MLVFSIIKDLKNFKDLTPPYHCLKRCAESTQLRPQLQRHAIGHRVEQRIELLTVIHLSGMCQLVKQHVVHQMWRQQHQVARQVDCACACATSPFRPRSSDTHFLVGQTMHRGKFGEQWRQKLLRPAFHCPDNGCRQQLLHFRTAELSVGRAKHRCLVVVKPHRENCRVPEATHSLKHGASIVKSRSISRGRNFSHSSRSVCRCGSMALRTEASDV